MANTPNRPPGRSVKNLRMVWSFAAQYRLQLACAALALFLAAAATSGVPFAFKLIIDDANQSVFAWLRKGRDPNARCVVAVNFTPEVRRDYRIRVPFAGRWREVLNTDAAHYGGSNTGNAGLVSAVVTPESPELHLVLPPLAAVYLVPEV